MADGQPRLVKHYSQRVSAKQDEYNKHTAVVAANLGFHHERVSYSLELSASKLEDLEAQYGPDLIKQLRADSDLVLVNFQNESPQKGGENVGKTHNNDVSETCISYKKRAV